MGISVSDSQSARNKIALAALGVVYGDIGTSPLYAMTACFSGHHPMALSQLNVYGVLSLVFWALIIVVTLKYVFFIMRADNHGEGGVLALMALARGSGVPRGGLRTTLVVLGIFGASLFYGDGIITPAISVLSAIEGLEVVAPGFHSWSMPIAIIILIALFSFQRKGTAHIGSFFGPVMLTWFLTLMVLGVINIVKHPSVFVAMNPVYALNFFRENGIGSLFIFGAIVLAVTGAEALYADMGHFGRQPIQRAWLFLVLPALVLNYYGQGALLLENPGAIDNPFYHLAPTWFLWPLLLLATCATVIGSQAVISGVFSVTRQAVQMGFWPRMKIAHTSSQEIGQIYIPLMNWLLMATVVLLIIGFRTSGNMAAAYGIAVTITMMVNTILAGFVAIRLWRWPVPLVLSMCLVFFIVDILFLGPNLLKIHDGGWFPLLIGGIVMTLMITWRKGRRFLGEALGRESMPLLPFVESLAIECPVIVPGTAVFMVRSVECAPHALLHNLKHNKVIHERVVLLNIQTLEIPFVPQGDRIYIEEITPQIFVIRGYYGFQEMADVPQLLRECEPFGLTFDMMNTSFFLSREHLIPNRRSGIPVILDNVFAIMSRNAMSATDYFNIPPNRVVELGSQLEI